MMPLKPSLKPVVRFRRGAYLHGVLQAATRPFVYPSRVSSIVGLPPLGIPAFSRKPTADSVPPHLHYRRRNTWEMEQEAGPPPSLTARAAPDALGGTPAAAHPLPAAGRDTRMRWEEVPGVTGKPMSGMLFDAEKTGATQAWMPIVQTPAKRTGAPLVRPMEYTAHSQAAETPVSIPSVPAKRTEGLIHADSHAALHSDGPATSQATATRGESTPAGAMSVYEPAGPSLPERARAAANASINTTRKNIEAKKQDTSHSRTDALRRVMQWIAADHPDAAEHGVKPVSADPPARTIRPGQAASSPPARGTRTRPFVAAPPLPTLSEPVQSPHMPALKSPRSSAASPAGTPSGGRYSNVTQNDAEAYAPAGPPALREIVRVHSLSAGSGGGTRAFAQRSYLTRLLWRCGR